jgi:hypothetical protein
LSSKPNTAKKNKGRITNTMMHKKVLEYVREGQREGERMEMIN